MLIHLIKAVTVVIVTAFMLLPSPAVTFADEPDISASIDWGTPVVGRWTEDRINAWYGAQPWLVGCNYYPASAINQIEMWQASTWDPQRIDLELSWASSIGMNTLRVYRVAGAR